MDDRLAALDGSVAAAADAWLADPQDARVYERLVRAVLDRRAHLVRTPVGEPSSHRAPHAELVQSAAGDDPTRQPGLEELLERRPVQSLGAALAGADPREVLDRLRGARPAPRPDPG
jgi:hypothetical protein